MAFLRWLLRLLTVLIVSHSVCVLFYYTPITHSSREAMRDALQRLHCAKLRRKFSIITDAKRESYWASNDKDVQLEFEITDAIYDLLGCSASQEIDVQLEFETDDHVSVGHCSPGEMHMELETEENQNISVCEVKDLQLEMNRNVSVSELKRPALVSEDLRDPAGPSVEDSDVQENSPTESTKAMKIKKSSWLLRDPESRICYSVEHKENKYLLAERQTEVSNKVLKLCST